MIVKNCSFSIKIVSKEVVIEAIKIGSGGCIDSK